MGRYNAIQLVLRFRYGRNYEFYMKTVREATTTNTPPKCFGGVFVVKMDSEDRRNRKMYHSFHDAGLPVYLDRNPGIHPL